MTPSSRTSLPSIHFIHTAQNTLETLGYIVKLSIHRHYINIQPFMVHTVRKAEPPAATLGTDVKLQNIHTHLYSIVNCGRYTTETSDVDWTWRSFGFHARLVGRDGSLGNIKQMRESIKNYLHILQRLHINKKVAISVHILKLLRDFTQLRDYQHNSESMVILYCKYLTGMKTPYLQAADTFFR